MLDLVRRTYHTGRYAKVRKLLGRKKARLLDIGCGKPCDQMEDGSFLRYIGFGTGLDTKRCDIHCDGIKFVRGDICDMRFAKGSFDAVVAMEILEHVPPKDFDKAMRGIGRVLRKDGKLIASVPDNTFLWRIVWGIWQSTAGKMWESAHKNEHTRKEWIEMIGRYFSVRSVQRHWLFDLVIEAKNDKEPKKADLG